MQAEAETSAEPLPRRRGRAAGRAGVGVFEVEIPDAISAATLDRRMAEGWFRTGPVFFRADMICLEESIQGLVHVRLPLTDDAPSRSRRRLLRRNRERFRVEVGPAQVDSARRHLYEATKPRFMSFVSSDVEPLVLGDGREVFDTRECAVYDADRLVAVSYFDVGAESVASQLALHDPEYARDSLGFYTLLEEIEYSREIGARFFYPGYVIPGIPSFDYKLRIGAVQYLEGSRWRRRAEAPRRVPGADRYARRIRALERALTREGVEFQARFYPAFWIGYLRWTDSVPFLCGMIHLRLRTADERGGLLLIEYSPDEAEFLLCRARVAEEIDVMEGYDAPGSHAKAYELRALYRQVELFRNASAREVAVAAREAVKV